MANDIERALQVEQDRVAHLPSDKLPVMTAAAQTRLSWARRVEDFAALPAVYRDFMADLLNGERPFPYAVLTPTFAGFMRREKEQLVFCLDNQLYLVERDGSRLTPTHYALADLNYVEVGSILLKAWITVNGLSSEGLLTSTTLKFNAVTDHLFAPFLRQIRAASAQTVEIDRNAELQKFDYLTTVDFKFRNFAYRSVRPGERVIGSLLQPEMRVPLLTFFGKTLSRLVATAHLCILTDAELIIIRDDEDSPIGQGGTRYGGVWQYLPLDKITTISVTNRNTNVLAVTLELPHGVRIDSLFEAARWSEVERFLHQLIERVPQTAFNVTAVPPAFAA